MLIRSDDKIVKSCNRVCSGRDHHWRLCRTLRPKDVPPEPPQQALLLRPIPSPARSAPLARRCAVTAAGHDRPGLSPASACASPLSGASLRVSVPHRSAPLARHGGHADGQGQGHPAQIPADARGLRQARRAAIGRPYSLRLFCHVHFLATASLGDSSGAAALAAFVGQRRARLFVALPGPAALTSIFQAPLSSWSVNPARKRAAKLADRRKPLSAPGAQ